MKKIQDYSRKDFLAVPLRKDGKEFITCWGIVIIPSTKRHDSGYRCMDFCALDNENEPVCRLSGCSDVLHIGGIGGQKIGYPWSIDVLPVSGLCRIWYGKEILAKSVLSSFEIVAIPSPSK